MLCLLLQACHSRICTALRQAQISTAPYYQLCTLDEYSYRCTRLHINCLIKQHSLGARAAEGLLEAPVLSCDAACPSLTVYLMCCGGAECDA